MENIIVMFVCLITLLIIYYTLNLSLKRIKEVKENKKIQELVKRFPEDEQICKSMLKSLKNEKVKTQITESDKSCVYIVIADKICIGNIKDIYTRIQTIAHECIHSIQDRKLLLFNFVFTNLYNLYFIISIILTWVGVIKNTNLQIFILTIMGFIFYAVRSYLETDAMIKAKYLAKDYMEEYIKENKVCNEKEVEDIIEEYDKTNKVGIPAYNYILISKPIIKIIVYNTIVIILNILRSRAL